MRSVDPERPVEAALVDELEAIACQAAADAADLIREARVTGVRVADTKSSDVDVVTEADRASERLIRQTITAARPDDEITGEEQATRAGGSGVRWIVDPIDGTVNFLYGLGRFCVSIAVHVDGEPALGVVREVTDAPDTDVTYLGRNDLEGERATRNGQPIRVNPPAALGQLLVGTGFSYDAERRASQGAAVARLLPQVRDIRRLGSCAIDLCLVACGALDAYVEEGVNEWDYAAGLIIARAAGAQVEKTVGATGADTIVTASQAGFEAFRDLVTRSGFLHVDVE